MDLGRRHEVRAPVALNVQSATQVASFEPGTVCSGDELRAVRSRAAGIWAAGGPGAPREWASGAQAPWVAWPSVCG
jgi:hypothetical protein